MEPLHNKGFESLERELDDKLMKYIKNEANEVDATLNEEIQKIPSNTDLEINITECTKSPGNRPFDGESSDTTASSSSFDGSNCGDSEASDYWDDLETALRFKLGGKYDNLTKRKTLTPYWGLVVQSLRWRCKWIELQLKRLLYKAHQYNQAIEAQNMLKQRKLGDSTLENGVKSLPFAHTNSRIDILKRKKRRKVEETTDVAAYVSCHNIFSYYATIKANTNDRFHSNSGDSLPIEQDEYSSSLQYIFCKIQGLQSQVGKLRGRVDRVMAENAEKFYLLNLQAPCAASIPNWEGGVPLGTFIASELISEYSIILKSHEGIPAANGRASLTDFVKTDEKNVLIDNRRVIEKLDSFEGLMIPPATNETINSDDVAVHPTQSLSVLMERTGVANPSSLTEPDVSIDDQRPPRIRSLKNILKKIEKRYKKRN